MQSAATVISSGGGHGGMEGKDLGVIETLRREISSLLHTMGEGDFAALLRFGRNNGGAGRCFCHLPF